MGGHLAVDSTFATFNSATSALNLPSQATTMAAPNLTETIQASLGDAGIQRLLEAVLAEMASDSSNRFNESSVRSTLPQPAGKILCFISNFSFLMIS